MQLVTSLSLLSLVIGGFASHGMRSHFRPGGGHTHAAHAVRNITKRYVLNDIYEGQSLIDEWDFFSQDDPTHGLVNYLTKEEATGKGLAYIDDDGTAVFAVDDTTTLAPGSNRDSVRLQTQKTYSGGLFIADIIAMPHGCSVWPAYWSVGPDWPAGGEIDVVEGVNDQILNQYTLHTAEGCTLSTGKKKVTGHQLDSQCATIGSDNTGCAFLDSDTRSYGQDFNDEGGGVFVHKWDDTGIKMWFFSRCEVPEDIDDRDPDPSGWGPPSAFYDSSSCDMSQHFYEHSLVLDTTLCGDWAGGTYSSMGCPGTCEEWVADPSNFSTAKWRINYIAVYQ